MLKNILNLEGAQKLTKNEQKSINGGKVLMNCSDDAQCTLTPGCNFGIVAYCYRGTCRVDAC